MPVPTCRTADVDDAVQDALCLLHRHVGSLRVISAFSGWMFAVVKRECIRLARRALRTPCAIETIEDDLRFAVRPEHELRLDLATAIQSLPAHYREVLVLRDMEELTIDEIARPRLERRAKPSRHGCIAPAPWSANISSAASCALPDAAAAA